MQVLPLVLIFHLQKHCEVLQEEINIWHLGKNWGDRENSPKNWILSEPGFLGFQFIES